MDIRIWPHPDLKKVSEQVTEPIDPELIYEMKRTMFFAQGVGLSAIQVGVPKAFFLMQVPGFVTEVLVNPVWKAIGKNKTTTYEGCLSLPGLSESTGRFDEVEVSFTTPDLKEVKTLGLKDLAARIVQHEVEHLRGEIFLDRLDAGARDRARKFLKGQKTWNPVP